MGSKVFGLLLSLMAFTFLGIGVAARAASTVDRDDLATLSKIHAVNLFEIQAGHLAEEKAENPAVKAFGKDLVVDHTQAESKLNSLAEEKKIQVGEANPVMAKETEDTLNQLKTTTGDDFQKKFLTAMVKGHSETISDVKAADNKTSDKDLKKFYTTLLPELKAHEIHAMALNKRFNK